MTERPWSTTMQASWRWPIRDSGSLCLHQRFYDHSSNKAVILSINLSWGRHACTLRESTSMPRMVRHVDGPSCLSGWRGIPSLEKQSTDISRLCWQTEEPGGLSHQGNASGRWHRSFAWPLTPLSLLYMWRYMELTWLQKGRTILTWKAEPHLKHDNRRSFVLTGTMWYAFAHPISP